MDPVVTCLSDFEALARDALPPATYAHIAGGSAAGQTVDANIAALKKFRIVSRVLVDCREGSTRVSLMGEAFAHPVLLAPVSYQRLVHPDGEIATAQAADALDTGMIVSTLASYPLEAVAEVLPRNKWFQLYLQARWDDTITLVRRTESAGYKALIVTVDAPVTGMRNQAERAGFTKPADVVAANLPASRDVGQIALDPGQSRVFQGAMSHAPTWEAIRRLLAATDLPIILKGVLSAADAHRAKDLGVSGLVVSNHGGRALAPSPTAVEVLPEIRQVVGKDFLLLADGGVRRGSDVFVYLALGADAVLIGRPQLYALAVNGASGVARLLRLVRDELEITMALAGCPFICDIGIDRLRRREVEPSS